MVSDRKPNPFVLPWQGSTPILMSALVLLAAILVVADFAHGGEDPPGDKPGDPAILALDFYQQYLSSLRNASCRFRPSCSEYARQAISKYGLFSGTARAADRLVRCNASAGNFYGRTADRGLDDPVEGAAHGRVVPRLEPWLLPAFAMEPPPVPAVEAARPDQVAKIEELVSFARKLSVEGDCWRAETEFLRAAHLSGSNDWRLWSHFQIGACYFDAGYWPDAERTYLKAGMLSADPVLRGKATHLLAASLFNDGRYSSGANLLADPGLTSRTLALRGLCRMALGNWGAAADDFATGANRAQELWLAGRMDHLEVAANEGLDLPRRSPGFAMFMSTLIPGSGQMYSGRVHDGIRHLIFNGILIFTLVKLIQNEHYPAAVGVGAIGIPFYIGNIRGGGYSARAFNRDRRLEHVAESIAEAGEI